MNAELLEPGEVSLAQWRAIYRGADVLLDEACWHRIGAGAEAVSKILERGEPVYGINTGFGKLASVRIEAADLATLQQNIVLSHAAGLGEPVPVPIVRLIMALKLASLAQGASGVRPETVGISGCDAHARAHAGHSLAGLGGRFGGSRAASASGRGDDGGWRDHAAEWRARCRSLGLASAGLAPIKLGPKEGLALLNGTQFSTACALAGLFESEIVFQGALVTGALATEAAKGSDTPFDPRIHALRRQRGQIEAAAALRALMAGSAIRASHRIGDPRVQDPYCLRCQPQVMGAVLDLLRYAATILDRESMG